MDPHSVFCPNPNCPARGQWGRGNMGIQSQRERRYRCSLCRTTFTERLGTPFYRCRVAPTTLALVLTLVAHGCPPQAIVAAFGFQCRTVRAWIQAAGRHCQLFHQHQVLPQELIQVQVTSSSRITTCWRTRTQGRSATTFWNPARSMVGIQQILSPG
jgi:transposase-like protein